MICCSYQGVITEANMQSDISWWYTKVYQFCITRKTMEWPPIWLLHYITLNPSIACESAGLQSKDRLSHHQQWPWLSSLNSCLIFPSHTQHPLTGQKACRNWSENTQSGNTACAFFMLSHSYSALPYLCAFPPLSFHCWCAQMRPLRGWAGSLYGRVSL